MKGSRWQEKAPRADICRGKAKSVRFLAGDYFRWGRKGQGRYRSRQKDTMVGGFKQGRGPYRREKSCIYEGRGEGPLYCKETIII